jgi:threonine/homoserine/homoserine lactone efflux protein
MPDAQHLLLFVLAGWLLNLTPGPDVLCIVTHAVRGGVRAGVAAAGGVLCGCLVHVIAATLGVAALLAASAPAFGLLKWAGAAYLAWTGVRMLRSAPPSTLASALPAPTPAASTRRAAFARGFLTNVLNPKVALFFLAFLPQFIAPGAPDATRVFLQLGLIFTVGSLPVCLLWAVAASWLARRAGAGLRGMHRLERAAGLMFIGFGVRLALTDNPAVAS